MDATEIDTAAADTADAAPRWQLVLAVGPASEWAAGLGDSTIAVTADPGVLDDVALGAADLRARAAVAVDSSDVGALSAWAYLSGLAGRILDVIVNTPDGPDGLDCAGLADLGRAAAGPRPELRVEEITLDSAAAAAGTVDADACGGARWAKRVSLDWAAGAVLYRAVAWTSGVRDRRGDGGRLPQVVVAGHSLDLEGIRLRGAARRRTTNAAAEAPLAPALAATARQERLSAAAAQPVEVVLAALGSEIAEELWNCPRPERHTHGDAVPSMRTSGGAVRCFRCDPEWTDVLRLVMDVTGLGPDDAADLILDGGLDPHRERIVAERAARSARAA